MNVSGDKSCNWVAVVLPMFGFITIGDWTQLGRPDEHVGEEDDSAHWDQTQHGVEVEHILEFVPLPPDNQTFRLENKYKIKLR